MGKQPVKEGNEPLRKDLEREGLDAEGRPKDNEPAERAPPTVPPRD